VKIDAQTPPGTIITNTAHVSSQSFDPNDEKCLHGDDVPAPTADLRVTKTADSDQSWPAQTLRSPSR
jgi:hypothetical protein